MFYSPAGRRQALVVALLPALLLLALPLHAQAPAANPDQTLELANGLFDQEHWQTALDSYEQFLKAAPEHANVPFALFRAGECHYNLGRYDRALPYYTRLTTDFAKSELAEEALYRTGDVYFRQEKFAEALTAYQAVLAQAPTGLLGFRAAYWLGETQYRLGQYAEAVASYEQSLKLSPDGNYAAYAAYSIALSKLKLGDMKDGIARLQALLEKYPKHELTPEVLYRLAEAHYEATEYAEAITRYQQVLKDYGGTRLAPRAQSGIAWSYWGLEKYPEALAAFQQLQKSEDETLAAEGALRAADCLFLLQRYQDAAAAYAEVVKQPGAAAPTALFWQAMSLERKPDKPGALKAFQEFVNANPAHERVAEAYLHLGALQVEANQLEAAEKSYQAAEKNTKDETLAGQARYGAAWAAYQRTKTPEALAAIEVIADQQPTSALGAQVAFQTGKLRFARGDYPRAIALLSALVQNHAQDPAVPEALYLLGASYDRANDAAKAEEFYKRSAEAAPGTDFATEATGGLIGLYARTGRADAAQELLTALAKQAPQSPSLAPAQYALAEARFAAKEYGAAADLYAAVVAAKNAELTPFAQYSLGACRFGLGDYKAAAEAFRTLLANYADATTAPLARYQLAISLGKLGQAAESIKLLEEFYAASPKAELADDVLIELGWAYLEQKQLPQAVATFEKLLAAEPQSPYAPEALFRLGEIRYDQGNYAGAQAAYQKLLADYPKSELADEAAYKLGWALLKQDKAGEALAPFTVAATSASDAAVGADARYQAAALHLRASQPGEAVKLLEPVRATVPAALAPRILLLLGQAYLGEKDAAKAAPVFEEIVAKYKDDPLLPRALLGLGRCYKAEKKYEEAATAFTQVTGTQDQAAAMAQFELAETRRLQNDPRTAAMEYLKVAILYKDPEWAARAQYAAGLCYEQAGAGEDAAKAYKVVVDRYKEQQEWAQKAEERLRALE